MASTIWRLPESGCVYRLVMPHLRRDTVMLDGHIFALDSIDSQLLSVNGSNEDLEIALFASCVEDDDVVVDIGAHIGFYCLRAARAVGPTGRVYAFEPASAHYGLLTVNVQRNGYTNVETVRASVTDSRGQAG